MTVEASPSLPAINHALEPAWVRNGSTETQKTYQTALAFERMLVEQLSKSLTAASGLEGESGSEADGSSTMSAGLLTSLLPQALSDGVMSGGGLGLAAQFTREAQNAHSAQHAQAAQQTQTQTQTQTNGGTASTSAHTTTAATGGVGT